MKHYLIFVPGIMGSQLSYTNDSVSNTEEIKIWSEQVYESLSNLIENPGLFKFNPDTNVNAKSIIRFLRLPYDVYRVDVYNAIERALSQLTKYEMKNFPYDWRQDIRDSAKNLQTECANILNQEKDVKFTFVGHSMGGLIIIYALIKKFIQPELVDKIVTIGTPFTGSPNAFKGLFDTGYLPGVNLLGTALNLRRNRMRCKEIMLQAHQSFTSIYQLLPPLEQAFIELGQTEIISPLSERAGSVVQNKKAVASANAFHKSIKKLKTFKAQNVNIKFLHVVDYGFDTDYFYKASISSSGMSFCNIEVFLKVPGDGTVPVNSACGHAPEEQIVRYVGCQHMTMCSDKRIINRVLMFLN